MPYSDTVLCVIFRLVLIGRALQERKREGEPEFRAAACGAGTGTPFNTILYSIFPMEDLS